MKQASVLLVLLVSCSPGNNGGVQDVLFEASPDGRIVAIVDATGFRELVELSRTEPRQFIQPRVQAYLRDYAERFPSDADFLFFLIDEHRAQLRFNALGGFNVTVNAPESGLGPIGSATALPNLPNLRSYIYLARKDSLVLGPSLHELAHAWGVRLAAPETLAEQVTSSDNHWGYSSAGGQLGGWEPGSLRDLGDGNFEIEGGNVEANGRPFNTVAYSPIERYLMGLSGPELVPPMEVAINPRFENLFRFQADEIVEVTIDEILEGNGLRLPEPENAQRDFKVAITILTDHVPSEDEWQFYVDSLDFFEADEPRFIEDAFPLSRYRGEPIRTFIEQSDPEDPQRDYINFFEATGGLATIQFINVAS